MRHWLLLYLFQNALSQKESEVNLTLGGIDLNNSGRYLSLAFNLHSIFVMPLSSDNHPWYIYKIILTFQLCSVVVREDKKILTVLFPDGGGGRAFTLKVSFCNAVVSAEIPFYLLFTNIMPLFALIWTTLTVILLYSSFLCNRLKLQRICISGKLLLKMLCLKHLVHLSRWDRMESTGTMLLMCLKGLLNNVCSFLSFSCFTQANFPMDAWCHIWTLCLFSGHAAY